MASKRILVIESEDEFAESLSSMFSGYDTEVSIITDGKSGLQNAKQDPPDLTILCVELPKMSGYSICNKLKKDKKLKSVPLIIMSSEATEETFEQHKKLKTRAEDYIIKPFSAEQILEKVTALIDLPALETNEDEELITIDDDEAFSIDDEEAFSVDEDEILIDDLPDLEDENIDIEGDDSTVIMESPLEGGEEMESFDDVFDELQMDDEPTTTSQESEGAEAAAPEGDSDDISDFDDVLDSINEINVEGDNESVADDEVDMSDLDLSLPDEEDEVVVSEEVIDDLEVTPDSESISAEDLEVAVEATPEEEAIEGLDPEPEQAVELEPAPAEESEPPPVIEEVEVEANAGKDAGPDPVLTTKLQNAETECSHLREKVEKLEQRLEEAHQTYEKRDAEAASLKRDTTKDKEFLALKTTINAKDREILDLKEEINRKEQEVLDIKEKIHERDEELANLQESVAKRDREIKENSDRFEDMLRQKNELDELHQTKMAEWDDRYTTETAKLEHELQVLKEEHETALQNAQEDTNAVQETLDQLKSTVEETKQRHTDEVYGLRTRYKNEIDTLEGKFNSSQQELEQVNQALDDERTAHANTQETAAQVPQLTEDLENANATISSLEQEVAELKDSVDQGEERVVKAYQKIKSDEKIKEKARKAVEIAFTLLADQVSTEEGEESEEISTGDQEEIHT
jgi:CheY-like chemotaxis protein